MKAVFKGYLVNSKISKSVVHFTIGKIYDMTPSEVIEGFYSVIDDKGVAHLIRPSKQVYDFEFIPSHDELSDDSCGCVETESKAKLRFYINGHEVDVIDFENVRYKVDQLDKGGVKCDTIKFEVKFQ